MVQAASKRLVTEASPVFVHAGAQGLVLDATAAQYGAKPDSTGAQGNGTDNGAAITSALTAAAVYGAKVYLPPGKYRSSQQLTVGQRGALIGSGNGQPSDDNNAATTIIFDFGVSGVKMTGSGSLIQEVALKGGGVSGLGLDIQNTLVRVRDVTIKSFGSHGFNLNSTGGFVYDGAQVYGLHVFGNGGNGVNVVGGSDSNINNFTGVNAVLNAGWGYWVQNAARNVFVGCHGSANTLGGVHDDGNSNIYDIYLEGGLGGTFDFGANSSYGVLWGRNYAMPTLTGAFVNAIQSGWEIHQNGSLRGRMAVRDASEANTTQWGMRVGSYGAGWMELLNFTTGVPLMRVDATVAASYWNTHFRPEGDGVNDLGSATNRWNNINAKNLNLSPTTQTTAPAAGAAAALPATPAGYLSITVNGTVRQVPYY